MQSRPLDGIRVLEIAAYISGPYAGSLLAALGAEVVKIEPLEGEAFRRGEGIASAYFVQYNSGKKSVALDLKSAEVVAAVRSLLPRFDVLIENMRPGKLEAIGLGMEVCKQINPHLVYASISGFGSGGVLRDRPAYDSMGQAFGGFYTLMNDANDVRLTGTCLADLITAITTALGIVASLVGRNGSPQREGAQLETSVLEAVSTLTIDAMTQAFDEDLDPIRQTRHPQAQNFCLQTASGDSIVLHLSSSEKFWRSLMHAVGREELIQDPRFRRYADRAIPENFTAIKQILEQEFARLPSSEWERRLIELDVPFAPALTIRQMAAHPQVQWLQLIEHRDARALVQPPWRMGGVRPQRDHHVPHVGEHTCEILSEVLSDEQLDNLLAKRAIQVYSRGSAGQQTSQPLRA